MILRRASQLEPGVAVRFSNKEIWVVDRGPEPMGERIGFDLYSNDNEARKTGLAVFPNDLIEIYHTPLCRT